MKNFIKSYLKFLIIVLTLFTDVILSDSLYSDPDTSGKVGDRLLIDVNNFKLPINNYGFLAGVNINQDDLGKLNDDVILFSGGFFLAGIINQDIWMSNVNASSLLKDYLPGAVQDSSSLSKQIFVVRSSDIPFGKSWDDWKDAVKFGAKFYDGDLDGIYNPVDKNYDGIWNPNEDMPYLLGNLTAWCVYNDFQTQRRLEATYPVGIEIRQTIVSSNKSGLQNTIFIIYSLKNTGYLSDSLTNVYFSIYTDPDIGDYSDDLTGCDTTLNSCYTYNDGEDLGLGSDPPAIFFTLLQGPKVPDTTFGGLSNSAINNFGINYIKSIFEGYRNLEPTSFQNYFLFENPFLFDTKYSIYNRMRGQKPEGGLIDPCIFSEGIVIPDSICAIIDPLFMYSGNPLLNNGWINNFRKEQRNMLSCGPFNLLKNDEQNIIVAYTAGKGTSALNSVEKGKELVQGIIKEYKDNFPSLTYEPGEPAFPVTQFKLFQNYPNPFSAKGGSSTGGNPSTIIRWQSPLAGHQTLKVYDVLGREVATLVDEFRNAGSYEVEFKPSVGSLQLASGVYYYQLRVSDFIQTKKMIFLK